MIRFAFYTGYNPSTVNLDIIEDRGDTSYLADFREEGIEVGEANSLEEALEGVEATLEKLLEKYRGTYTISLEVVAEGRELYSYVPAYSPEVLETIGKIVVSLGGSYPINFGE